MTKEEILQYIKNELANEDTEIYLGVDDYKVIVEALEQKPTEKCKWIKYDYRTMCPKEHDIDNPYWRIPENRMETLKYCPYCGKEIEVEE